MRIYPHTAILTNEFYHLKISLDRENSLRKRNFWHRALLVVMALVFSCACILPGCAVSLGPYEDDPFEAGLPVFVSDNQQSAYSARSTWQLFTMKAQHVTELVTTKSTNKWFTKEDLVHGGLLVQGSCQSALAGYDCHARLGACVYWPASGEYMATHYVDGSTIYETYPVSDFSAGETYYGFIRNLGSSSLDSISGRLSFYDTNEA